MIDNRLSSLTCLRPMTLTRATVKVLSLGGGKLNIQNLELTSIRYCLQLFAYIVSQKLLCVVARIVWCF